MATVLVRELRTLSNTLKRNYGVSSILLQKAQDPIQQLFVEKIREYSKKKK